MNTYGGRVVCGEQNVEDLFVSGVIASTTEPEVINTPLNGSVAFLKNKDIFVTSDYWKIMVNFEFAAYEDAITMLRDSMSELKGIASRNAYEDMMTILHANVSEREEGVKHLVPVGELRQLKTVLDSLETKLRSLQEFLPRADPRRGLFNAGGSVLKVLFGLSTEGDLEELHSTIRDLHNKEATIVHSLNQQVTYLKQLDGTVKFNFQAIGNLSSTLKAIATKAQEGFQEVATRLAWYNKQREAATAVRQLEFALMKLEISIDELIDALQFVLLGKVPLNLLKPNVLQEMLKNVTMVLPEGREMIAGLNLNNMYLYYDMIQVTVLADVHSFKLVLNVPLKTVNRHFELYEIVVFPIQLFNNTFAKFVVEEDYFAINLLQRTYFTMSSADILKCKGKDILIQRTDSQNLCQRSLLLHHKTPMLQ